MTCLKGFGALATLAAWTTGFAAQKVVCIDPGHPSEVGRGTSGRRISEMSLVWRVAQRLSKKLERAGFRVVLTKSREDQFVTNRARARVANNAGAALMVRLHCDAASGTGFTVYYPDRQGMSHGVRGPSTQVLSRTKTLAIEFHRKLALSLKGVLRDNGLKSDTKTAVGSRQGALTGSIFSMVPVVLIEMCVLTNPKDESLMLSPRGMDAMTDALAAAICAAVPPGVQSNQTPHDQPAPAKGPVRMPHRK